MSIALQKRLMKEYREMKLEPPPNCEAKPVENEKGEMNLREWQGQIIGPEGTPYENGVFRLSISFSVDYPFKPPLIRFLTKIYHCNINGKGGICLDILKDNWTPSLTLPKVLLSVNQLLTDPCPQDPLVKSIAVQYLNHRELHDQTAREWTRKFAIKL